MKDYSGPFKKDIKYEDFSKDALVGLLHGYGEEINMLNLYLAAEITERYGEEAMREIELAVWQKMAAHELDPPLQANQTTTYNAEVVGTENVTVPAGTFTCYKVEFINSARGNLESTEWWDVDGSIPIPVKVINAGMMEEETLQLKSYTPA